MGRASNAGSVASIIAFGAGLYVGVNMGFPFPLSWAAGITLGIVLSGVISSAFEIVDHRKRYAFNTFGTHVTRDVYEDQTVEDCFSCSGADHEGYRVEWSKDDVTFGLVSDRHGGGIAYYCTACHEDDIAAGLRAGKEREFRRRYEGEDHYMDVLADLRDEYLAFDGDSPPDFWEYAETALAHSEAHSETDPREWTYDALKGFPVPGEDDESDEDESDRELLDDDDRERVLEESASAGSNHGIDGLPDDYY